jgi:hypothetical protein
MLGKFIGWLVNCKGFGRRRSSLTEVLPEITWRVWGKPLKSIGIVDVRSNNWTGHHPNVTIRPIRSFPRLLAFLWTSLRKFFSLKLVLPHFAINRVFQKYKINFSYFVYVYVKMTASGLVVTVLGYRSGGPGSIPGTTRKKKCSGSGTGSTQPREYNLGATW